jgi:hypothetical protein
MEAASVANKKSLLNIFFFFYKEMQSRRDFQAPGDASSPPEKTFRSSQHI